MGCRDRNRVSVSETGGRATALVVAREIGPVKKLDPHLVRARRSLHHIIFGHIR